MTDEPEIVEKSYQQVDWKDKELNALRQKSVRNSMWLKCTMKMRSVKQNSTMANSQLSKSTRY